MYSKTNNNNSGFLGLWASGFCYFAALGFVLPFVPLLLEGSGLTYAEIGIIYMAGLLFSVILQTAWGTLADRVGKKTIIIIVTTLSAILSAIYPQASNFAQFLLLGLLWYAFLAAATTVTPALTMDISEGMTIGRRFGRYRISGSIGWIFSTAASGLIAQTVGIQYIFYLAAALYLLSAAFLQIFIKSPPASVNKNTPQRKLGGLVRNRNFAIFLATVFMANISASTFSSFLSLYINKLGGSDVVVGWAFAISAVMEIPCMIYFGALSDKIGRKPLLIAALLAYPLRSFLYTIVFEPSLILPIQLLHGLTFGVFYVASIAFVSDTSSENRGTALGLYNTASSAGSAAGSALAGGIAQQQGLVFMYQFMTVFSLIPIFLFTLSAKETVAQ